MTGPLAGTDPPSILRTYIAWAAALLCLWSLSKAVYNVYFHPLSRFPGPKLAVASLWWQTYLDLWKKDSLSLKLVELHATYGNLLVLLNISCIPRSCGIQVTSSGLALTRCVR